MSVWSDLLQAIPLNAVLQERLKLAEQKYKDMEEDNKGLKERVMSLEAENAALKERVEKAPVAVVPPREEPKVHNGLYFFDEKSGPHCPSCYEDRGKMQQMSKVGNIGRQCPVCQNFVAS